MAWEVGNIFGTLGDDPMPEEAAPAPEPASSTPEPVPEPEVAKPAHERAAPASPKPVPTPKGARKAKGAPRPSEFARLPDGWSPDPMQVAFAVNLGLDAERVARKFAEHWTNTERGRKAKRRDWNLSWENWCREDAEDARARGVPALRGGGAVGSFADGREIAVAGDGRVLSHFEAFRHWFPQKKEFGAAQAAFERAEFRIGWKEILLRLGRWWPDAGCMKGLGFLPLARNWLSDAMLDEERSPEVDGLSDEVLRMVLRAMAMRGEGGEPDPQKVGLALRAALGLKLPEGYAGAEKPLALRGMLIIAGADFDEAERLAMAGFEASLSLGARLPDWGRFRPVTAPKVFQGINFGDEIVGFVHAAAEAEGVPPAAVIAGRPALLAGSVPA